MNHLPLRSVILAGCWIAASLALPASGADEFVPAPTQVLSPKASLTFYLDAASAEETAVWKAIDSKATSLSSRMSGMTALPGFPAKVPSDLGEFASLKHANLAELALVMEGNAAGLESGNLDADASFTFVARLSGEVDREALIGELLAALEKEQAGLSNQVASSRTKTGVADTFKVPSEALGGPSMPFEVRAALGPAKAGTIFALGRREGLEAYLGGTTPGRPAPQVETLLPRRGQCWLHLADLSGAAKGIQGAGAMAQNPMTAGIATDLEKIKELGMSLSFGTSTLDLQVVLGCADAGTAQKLVEGVQGFVGMMQMMGAQKPDAMPGFLAKLEAVAEQTRFRLSTSLTLQDIDLAIKNLESALPHLPTGTPAPAQPPPKIEPLADISPPVELEFLGILPGESLNLRRGKMRITNRAAKPVRDLRLSFEYLNMRGQPAGEWTRRQQDLGGDTLVRAADERVLEVNLFKVPPGTENVRLRLHDVTFTDGTTWTAKP